MINTNNRIRGFLILRKLKIKPDPLSLFRDREEDYYEDFGYDYYGEDAVDGYEINIFDTKKQTVRNIGDYKPIFSVSKKHISSRFLGNRNVGDIGYLIESMMIDNTLSVTCDFSEESYNEYFPIMLNYYTDLADNADRSRPTRFKKSNIEKIKSLLIRNNRDKKINTII